MTEPRWPESELNQVRRLRVIAAATPGAVIHERVLNAPLASVWAVAADLEGELPLWLFPDIRSVRLTPTEADRSQASVLGYSGLRARFDVVLQPGWCLMQSRLLVGGMAAAPEHGGTRFALLGGFRGPLRLLGPLTHSIAERTGRRAVARFAQRVGQRQTGEDV